MLRTGIACQVKDDKVHSVIHQPAIFDHKPPIKTHYSAIPPWNVPCVCVRVRVCGGWRYPRTCFCPLQQICTSFQTLGLQDIELPVFFSSPVIHHLFPSMPYSSHLPRTVPTALLHAEMLYELFQFLWPAVSWWWFTTLLGKKWVSE